jgi:hypothetical protein
MPLTQVQSGMMDSVAQYYSMKNRIINGAMVIDQRNAGASVTPTNAAYTLDRWQAQVSQNSKFTIQQNAASVTPPAGFSRYLGVTSSSAYSVLSSDYFIINQYIEGFNFADMGFGTASASSITLSFWVRSSLTGTFAGSIFNAAFNRSYPFTYTINSANTWEKETITIAGDTSGTWVGSTNGIGAGVCFNLGSGSTYSGTAGAWTGSGLFSATGATSVVGTNGATFYITGVQLEEGVTATSFDYRPYTTEFQLCQRYFQEYLSTNGAIFRANGVVGQKYYWMPFSTAMRVNPTMSVGTPTYYNMSAASWANAGQDGAEIFVNASGADGYVFVPWTASAEL